MPKVGTNTTLKGGGFHHLAFKVSDLDASLRFYVDGLGCRRAYGWGNDARAEGGADTRAVLLDTGDGNYLELFGGRAASDGGSDGVLLHFALRTTDCNAALEAARAAGAVVTIEPKTVAIEGDTPTEFRVAFVKGPDGELIEFFQNDML